MRKDESKEEMQMWNAYMDIDQDGRKIELISKRCGLN
jgi:primase-polymerase (primpol)-like protein